MDAASKTLEPPETDRIAQFTRIEWFCVPDLYLGLGGACPNSREIRKQAVGQAI